MKKTILIIAINLLGFCALAQSTNTELIQEKILGKIFCYKDNKSFGWIFSKDGRAVRHGYNLGMPGPDNFYKLTYFDTPRTYGSFSLVNSHGTLDFQIGYNYDLYEYSTGKTLSTKACK